MTPELDQQELFAAESPPVRRRTVPLSSIPKWTKYSNAKAKKPHFCDFCILDCHDDYHHGLPWKNILLPRKARYRRQTSTEDWYLCARHANDQRVVDGLPQFKAT